LPLLSVDPVLMQQVFINLLENALKYTPEGSPLEITAAPVGTEAEIRVRDHGPGIPKGEEERIFEKFQRGNHVGVGGVGLGLPICRGIIESHGGTVHAANAEGGGAVFIVRIPLVPGGPPAVLEAAT
jgi:two-component system sensor histidine kinase KdpD